MRLFICIIICLLINSNQFAQSIFNHGRLGVAKDGHYLQFADGKAFFWLGDRGGNYFTGLILLK